jgi:diacylglycerol kinase family enzyme
MPGIGLVLNPHAKRHAKDPGLADRLARTLGGDGIVRPASTFEELAEVVEELRRQRIDVLAIAGGDGTNHSVITHLVRAYGDQPLPYVALLRGGTMNTTANSFGIARKKPEALLTRYKRAYAQQALVPMRFVEPHVLRVADRYGFIFGTGAIYGFIAEYNSRADRSPAWAARVLATAIASSTVGGPAIRRVAQRWVGSVRFDDGTAFPDRDYLTVGASTCGQIGLGFKPFYRSHERHGHIHVLGIHCSAGDFIRGLPRIWRGVPQGGERTFEKLCPRAVMVPRVDEVPYMIDGDVYVHQGELEIACGPKLRILMP